MKNLPTLTGLRGAAALFVALGHLSNEGLFLPILVGAAKIGVWIFFILSAYLMTKLYLDRSPKDHGLEYALARIGRVFPLYYVVLIASVCFIGNAAWRYDLEDTAGVISAALMTSAPRELWAVPVEVQFYFFFGIFWIYWHRMGRLSPMNAFIALSLIVLAQVVVTFAKLRAGMDINGLNLYMHIFVIGVGCAIYEKPIAGLLGGMEKSVGRRGLSLLAFLLLLASLPALRREFGVDIGSRVDPIAVIASLLIFQLSLRSTGIFAFLGHPAFIRLGTVSYGFYLLHHLVITWSQAHLGNVSPFLLTPAILIVSLVLAEVSYRVLERPASQAIRKLALERRSARVG